MVEEVKHLREVPLLLSSWFFIIKYAILLLIPNLFACMNATPLKEKIMNADHSREPLKGTNPMHIMKDLVFTKESMVVKQHLNIAIPNKSGFKEFVEWSIDSNNEMVFDGYSIAIFKEALRELDYKLNYTFIPIGDGTSTPMYDEMIDSLYNGVYDAVVGDVTIRSNRAIKVDFTQAYSESGLVVVTPLKDDRFSGIASFANPFTGSMWVTIGACLIFTGIIIWILEHEENHEFRGPPLEQAKTIFWFMGSTMFLVHRESIRSGLARLVVIVWLFVVLILVSSYTASLSSILTVRNLHPTIDGIEELKRSTVRIGYQSGSFIKNFLIHEFHIAEERLVSLNTMENFTEALRLGPGHKDGVGAIVDELPYVQLFLSRQCDFTIAGDVFTRSGLGYAFPKNSEVGKDISLAILRLSESGRLQEIHDRWMSTKDCRKLQVQSNKLGPENFIGLLIITIATSLLCLFVYIGTLWHNFRHQDGVPNNQPILQTLRICFRSTDRHINFRWNQFALEILRGYLSNTDLGRVFPNQPIPIIPQILRSFLSYVDQLDTFPNEYPHQILKKFVSYIDLHMALNQPNLIPEVLRKFVSFMDNEPNEPILELLRRFANDMPQNMPLDEPGLLVNLLRLFFEHIDGLGVLNNQINYDILRAFFDQDDLPGQYQPILETLNHFVMYLQEHNVVI